MKRRNNGALRLSELTTTTVLADTEVNRGELISSGGTMHPASISSNGFELFIVTPDTKKAHLFVLSTNTLTEITSIVGNTNPVWGAFIDSYFVALDDNGKFYISSPNDGSTWDALDVATPESNPDRASMIFAHSNHLWIFGPESIEIWINTGNALFPFEPIRHATIQKGLLLPLQRGGSGWIDLLGWKGQVWGGDSLRGRGLSASSSGEPCCHQVHPE